MMMIIWLFILVTIAIKFFFLEYSGNGNEDLIFGFRSWLSMR